jgi:hypothetical protein
MFVSHLINLGVLKTTTSVNSQTKLYDRHKDSIIFQSEKKKNNHGHNHTSPLEAEVDVKPRFGVSTGSRTPAWMMDKHSDIMKSISKNQHNKMSSSKGGGGSTSSTNEEKDDDQEAAAAALLKEREDRVRVAMTAAEEADFFLKTIQHACQEVKTYDNVRKSAEKKPPPPPPPVSKGTILNQLEGDHVEDEYVEEDGEEYEIEPFGAQAAAQEQEQEQQRYDSFASDEYVYDEEEEEEDEEVAAVARRSGGKGGSHQDDVNLFRTTMVKNNNVDEVYSLQSTQQQSTMVPSSSSSQASSVGLNSFASTASLLYSVKVEDMKFNSSKHALNALPKLIKSLRVEVCKSCYTWIESVFTALDAEVKSQHKHSGCRVSGFFFFTFDNDKTALIFDAVVCMFGS